MIDLYPFPAEYNEDEIFVALMAWPGWVPMKLGKRQLH